MKVFKFLLIGLLSINGRAQGPPTNNAPNHPNDSSDVKHEPSSSGMIGAHARLGIGFNLLSLLTTASTPHIAISGYFNIEWEIIDGLMKVDRIEMERLIQKLMEMDIKKDIQVEDLLKGINALETIYEELDQAPPLSSEVEQMHQALKDWKTTSLHKMNTSELIFNREQLVKLEKLALPTCIETAASEPCDDFSHLISVAQGARDGVIGYTTVLRKLMDNFKELENPDRFFKAFRPIQKVIEIFEAQKNQTDSIRKLAGIEQSTVDTLGSLLGNSTSFVTAAHVVKSLNTISKLIEGSPKGRLYTGAYPDDFLDLDMFSVDLEHEAKWMDLTQLKTELAPLFEAKDVMKTYWIGLKNSITSVKDGFNLLENLLNALMGSSEVVMVWPAANKTFNSFLFIKTPPYDFSKVYKDAKEGFKMFSETMKGLETSSELMNISDAEGIARIIDAYIDSIQANDTSLFNSFKKSDKFQKILSDSDAVISKIQTTNSQIAKIQQKFARIDSWKVATLAAEKWICGPVRRFKDQMKQSREAISIVKTALTFVKLQKSSADLPSLKPGIVVLTEQIRHGNLAFDQYMTAQKSFYNIYRSYIEMSRLSFGTAVFWLAVWYSVFLIREPWNQKKSQKPIFFEMEREVMIMALLNVLSLPLVFYYLL